MSANKLLLFILALLPTLSLAQTGTKPAIYVDKNGVLRWQQNQHEAAFFGVNYTTPFAYAYRAHKALGVDLEKAIQQDVYHMARLGFDAFRVHVWDNEISDVSGNLLNNDHLKLFDFLLAELKKRNIKVIITPIAFWGNGYPEPDENTPGFSRHYGRAKLTTNDSAIVAQENYLHQFFAHVNPYTNLAYKNDPDVIAIEINNEPSHSGPKDGVTKYINQLAAAIKSTGWHKPLFYNISQGPYYADAVAASSVDGFSFQWYPSGLLAGGEIRENYLTHVDRYTIPFDTIPSFARRALMIYEFDAADILKPVMYPAMARSFRAAGFQWATQFAYDPMALAYANTEYQTHYLNLAYTPSKAISMLIASRIFHQVPRRTNFPAFPADTLFDSFRISYRQSVSEMNSEKEFLYAATTSTQPRDSKKIEHLAGVGSSPIVSYGGTGAYFFDKVDDGVWRMEIMPDAISVDDPFARPSPRKEVTAIRWQKNAMKVLLPDLAGGFSITGVNDGNDFSGTATGNSFDITPGTYLLTRSGKKLQTTRTNIGVIGLKEFVAPQPHSNDVCLRHEPRARVTSGKPLQINATVVGVDSGEVTLMVNRFWGMSKQFPMRKKSRYEFTAEIPGDLVVPGMLNYRIVVQKKYDFTVFPGRINKNPMAWDYTNQETWQTLVDDSDRIELFNPTVDKTARIYPAYRQNYQTSYITADLPRQLVLRIATKELTGDHVMGFQFALGNKLQECGAQLNDRVVVRARSTQSPVKAKLVIIDSNGHAIASSFMLTNSFQDVEMPLSEFIPSDFLLLPRPFPSFLPLRFNSPGIFRIADVEKIEMTIGSDLTNDLKKPYDLEVASIMLVKSTNTTKP